MKNPQFAASIIKIIDLLSRPINDKKLDLRIQELIKTLSIPSLFPIDLKFKFLLFKLLPFGKFNFSFFIKNLLNNFLTDEKRLFQIADFKQKVYLNESFSEDLLCEKAFQYLSFNGTDAVAINLGRLLQDSLPCAQQHSLGILSQFLKKIIRKIKPLISSTANKFLHIDQETYKNYALIIEAYKKVLNEEEFFNVNVSITLQTYIPESFEYQKELTSWALQRCHLGASPIKINLVKGGYLSYELITSSKKNWPLPTFASKTETDANFKKMLLYAVNPNHLQAVHYIVSTHNLLDLSYALILRSENNAEKTIEFEMTKGQVPYLQRTLKIIIGSLTLYSSGNFAKHPTLFSYFLRRIEEIKNQDNFLSQFNEISVSSSLWQEKVDQFIESCKIITQINNRAKHTQNRFEMTRSEVKNHFANEPITNFSLKSSHLWAKEITTNPIMIDLKVLPHDYSFQYDVEERVDLWNPKKPVYQIPLYNSSQLNAILEKAKNAEKRWQQVPMSEKIFILGNIAQKLKEKRTEFTQVLMRDISKTIMQADLEVSEAIDSIEYQRNIVKSFLEFSDVCFGPKGTVLAITPKSFPLSSTAETVASALLMGNCVLYTGKESSLTSYLLLKLFWESNIPKDVLHFINYEPSLLQNYLVKDERINSLHIATSRKITKNIIKSKKSLDIQAVTGSKNSIIITAFADIDLALQDLVHSAFSFNGQKFSSCSLAIVESPVYNDKNFRETLQKKVGQLKVGLPTDLSVTITPMMQKPDADLLKAINTLEEGEHWLVKPQISLENPFIITPGVKMGVKPGSFSHLAEIYGPVLFVMEAKNLDEAIHFANRSSYGSCAGLHSLDEKEHDIWLNNIESSNLFINRKITDTIVKRQPFGGYKESIFGDGYKSCGPNYLLSFMTKSQIFLPHEKQPVNEWVEKLNHYVEKMNLPQETLSVWSASILNYAYWWRKFKYDKDTNKVLGEDNLLRYVPRKRMTLRIDHNSNILDALRICAAALTCHVPLEISFEKDSQKYLCWLDLIPVLKIIEETEETLISKIKQGKIKQLRMAFSASFEIKEAVSDTTTLIIDDPVLANGRFELMHYLREVTISRDYHRYGYLGLRENEIRTLPQ